MEFNRNVTQILREYYMKKEEEFYIIDTHAHYDDEVFDNDRDELLKSFKDHNIKRVVNIGASIQSSINSLELARKYSFIYAVVGIHPSSAIEMNDENYLKLEELIKDEKTVAIGEIGLDYYYEEPSKQLQRKCFVKQLELAKEYEMPVVIHSRDAAKDTYDILKEYKNVKGVIHCYSYSKEMAREFIKLGYVLGIGGVATFKNAKTLKEVIKDISFDDFVIETDCPYLAPMPNRGKRNSSLNLKYIISTISEVKAVSEDFVIQKAFKNAKKLYPKMK